LNLDLKNFEDWNLILPSRHDSRVVNVSTWSSTHGRAVRTVWTTELNRGLRYLTTTIEQSQKPRILRNQATSELHPLLPLLGRRDYLFLSAIRAFVSAESG
jgi:hypothetical protein